MSPRILAAPKEQLSYLKDKTGCALTDDFNAIMAVRPDNRIVGMVGYCNWTQNAVQMHIAVDYPMVWRHLVGPGLEYPFLQVGKGVAIGILRASNAASHRFANACGFRLTHRVKDAWGPGDDLLLLELRKDDWLKERPLSRTWNDAKRERKAA